MLSCSAVIADFLMLQNYPQNANISISQDPEWQTAALSDPRPFCSRSRPLVRFLLKIIYEIEAARKDLSFFPPLCSHANEFLLTFIFFISQLSCKTHLSELYLCSTFFFSPRKFPLLWPRAKLGCVAGAGEARFSKRPQPFSPQQARQGGALSPPTC